MTAFNQLTQPQYINLETFRKSGIGVKTPVWFVQEGETLFVRTVANSGKVKRIRNNTHVNIAPCKADGALLGEWVPALARELRNEEVDRKVNRLLSKKYGLMKTFFTITAALQRRKYTVLEISKTS